MVPTFNGGMSQAINGQFMPAGAMNALDGFATSGFQLPAVAQAALERSASGANLYGTPAFDEAVQASMRAARPSLASGFAGGGQGALKGGLAQIGMQQAASDAFARLYGDERNRQLSAANQLGSFGLAGRDQQIGAATNRGNLAVQEQGLRNQALSTLGSAMSAERSRQLAALQSAPSIGLMGINALNGMGAQAQQTAQNQMNAGYMNQQNQYNADFQNSMNPVTQQQMLLAAALNGLPLGAMMGQSTTGTQQMYRNAGAGALGGAMTGAQLGSMFGPWGTAIGAVGGGLLGYG
jgi:hypothetical protein